MGAGVWPFVIVKELFVGLATGFSFGVLFWAIGNAGNLIDAKVGTTMSQVIDPLAGHQTSLMGLFLSQFAAYLFMASGAFIVFLRLLLESYKLWPVASYVPLLKPVGEMFFIDQFSYLMTAALLLSAPALVVMSLIDIGFGLVNRYAQQLNVFQLAMPIKAWVAIWIVLLMLSVFVQTVLTRLFHNAELLNALKEIF
jgi:type III secretion protein T